MRTLRGTAVATAAPAAAGPCCCLLLLDCCCFAGLLGGDILTVELGLAPKEPDAPIQQEVV